MLNFQGIILYLIAITSPGIGQYIYFIIYFLVDDIINFEINLSFLMKPFSYMTKKSGQNKKCLGFHASLRVRFFSMMRSGYVTHDITVQILRTFHFSFRTLTFQKKMFC